MVIREFAKQGVPVRAVIRDLVKAKEIGIDRLPGVECVAGDMLRPATLGPALRGVRRVLLISSPRERMVETQCTFVDAAAAAGVEHVVKFSGKESGIGFEPRQFKGTREHAEIERYIEGTGVAWTHLRPSQFMELYLPGTLTGVDPVRRALVMPIGESRLAPVAIDDIARVCVALLRSEGHEGMAYDMTGPEALTMTEVVQILTKVTGERFDYLSVSHEEKRAELSTSYPPPVVDLLCELFAERSRRPESNVALETHRRFGVEPTRFEDFARQHAATFLGDGSEG